MKSLKGKFCDRPFRFMEVGVPENGKTPCFACCPTWLPKEVGDLSKMTIEESWNSEEMQQIRRSILRGSFEFCNKELCPEILSDSLHDLGTVDDPSLEEIFKNSQTVLESGPAILNLRYDETCNLACPSCRQDFIISNKGERRELIEQTSEKIWQSDFKQIKKFIVCSSGDPFSSDHYQQLLTKFPGQSYPQTKFQIVTNGVLFTREMWNNLDNIHENVDEVCISLDAAKENTYNIVRRGGNFKKVIENLKFLAKLFRDGKLKKLRLDFVVQKQNYMEMKEFVLLGKSLGVSEVYFQKISNWGTFSDEQFLETEVHRENHPEYPLLLQHLEDPIFEDPIANLGNLSPLKRNWKREENSFSLVNAIKHTLKKRWLILKQNLRN